jgi:hypothetical protein
VKEILADHDVDKDGKISFEEFKTIFIIEEDMMEIPDPQAQNRRPSSLRLGRAQLINTEIK